MQGIPTDWGLDLYYSLWPNIAYSLNNTSNSTYMFPFNECYYCVILFDLI